MGPPPLPYRCEACPPTTCPKFQAAPGRLKCANESCQHWRAFHLRQKPDFICKGCEAEGSGPVCYEFESGKKDADLCLFCGHHVEDHARKFSASFWSFWSQMSRGGSRGSQCTGPEGLWNRLCLSTPSLWLQERTGLGALYSRRTMCTMQHVFEAFALPPSKSGSYGSSWQGFGCSMILTKASFQ